MITQIGKSKDTTQLATVKVVGELNVESLQHARKLYYDNKGKIQSIHIKNSYYEQGNYSHGQLIENYFTIVYLVDSKIVYKAE